MSGTALWEATWQRPSFAGDAHGPVTFYPREHIDLGPKFNVDVLVREEYKACFKYLEETHKGSLANKNLGRIIVTGQTGIGKSLFLVYALIRRIMNGKPTALQLDAGEFLLFDGQGVQTLPDKRKSADQLGPEVWALFDSNNKRAPVPGPAFTSSSALVVVASSPRSSRWQEWRKEEQAILWVMDIWSEEELEQVFEHRFPTMVEQAMQLCQTYGPSPRAIVEILRNVLLDHMAPTEAADDAVNNGITDLLSDPAQTLRMCPNGAQIRESTRFVIPTTFMLDKLAEGVLAMTPAAQRELLDAMKVVAPLRKAAGELFERLVHAHLTSGVSGIQCQVANGDTVLMHPASRLVGTQQAMSEMTTPFYWPSDCPGIDAVLFDSHHLCYLQITLTDTRKEGDLVEGVIKARAKLHPTVQQRPAYVVAIGIAERDATAVMRSLADNAAELDMHLCSAVLPLATLPNVDVSRLRPSESMMLTD